MSAKATQADGAVSVGRRKFLTASGALAIAGCATRPLGTYETAEVPAPTWRVGDRWTYQLTDFYTRLDVGTVTREVISVGPNGYRITTLTAEGRLLDDAVYTAAGIQAAGNLSEDSQTVAGTLAPPFERYAFPLTSGKEWRQYITRTDAGGFRNPVWTNTRVEGWETIQAGGRTVRAILIRRDLNLGPKDPFHGDLYRWEVEWYAPELRGTARLQMDEWYFERRTDYTRGTLPGARYSYELVSFAVA